MPKGPNDDQRLISVKATQRPLRDLICVEQPRLEGAHPLSGVAEACGRLVEGVKERGVYEAWTQRTDPNAVGRGFDA